MKKTVAVLLADGFEEGEAVVFIDLVRRAGMKVDVLACKENTSLDSYFETKITADYTLSDKIDQNYDAIMMPGGPQGTDNLTSNPSVIKFIKRHIALGRWICALCSSPAKVLGKHGLLTGKHFVTGSGLEEMVVGGIYVDAKVVVDGNFITSKGLGCSFDFALTVAQALRTDDPSHIAWQADHIYYEGWPESVKYFNCSKSNR